MQRVSTGVKGLDKLVEGGYPERSIVLLSGGPGTGKTTFGMQYIYEGALKKEPGIYVSFEQEPKQLKSSVQRYGMDFDKLEKDKKAKIMRIKDTKDIITVLDSIKKEIKRLKAKRLVIDSLSSLELIASTFRSLSKTFPPGIMQIKFPVPPAPEALVKMLMYSMVDYLKELDVTVLITSEAKDENYSRYGIAEFVTDGLITIDSTAIGKKLNRTLEIKKLRETKIKGGKYGINFGKKGLTVLG